MADFSLPEGRGTDNEEVSPFLGVPGKGRKAGTVKETIVEDVAPGQSLSGDSLNQARSRDFRRGPFFSISIRERYPHFFGREEILLQLRNILTHPPMASRVTSSALSLGKFILIHGVGGVGKTAIALELMYRVQQSYDNIF